MYCWDEAYKMEKCSKGNILCLQNRAHRIRKRLRLMELAESFRFTKTGGSFRTGSVFRSGFRGAEKACGVRSVWPVRNLRNRTPGRQCIRRGQMNWDFVRGKRTSSPLWLLLENSLRHQDRFQGGAVNKLRRDRLRGSLKNCLRRNATTHRSGCGGRRRSLRHREGSR
jgi:hypothetical protein